MFQEAQKGAAMSDAQDDRQQQQQVSELMADAEVAAAERLLKAAELEFDSARSLQQRWSSEANSVRRGVTDAPSGAEGRRGLRGRGKGGRWHPSARDGDAAPSINHARHPGVWRRA